MVTRAERLRRAFGDAVVDEARERATYLLLAAYVAHLAGCREWATDLTATALAWAEVAGLA